MKSHRYSYLSICESVSLSHFLPSHFFLPLNFTLIGLITSLKLGKTILLWKLFFNTNFQIHFSLAPTKKRKFTENKPLNYTFTLFFRWCTSMTDRVHPPCNSVKVKNTHPDVKACYSRSRMAALQLRLCKAPEIIPPQKHICNFKWQE